MKKRFSAFLLAALMVAALLPVMSFADGITTGDELRAAVTAADDGDTVTLTQDITVDGDWPALFVKSGVTIDGAGHTLSVGKVVHTHSAAALYGTGYTVKNLTLKQTGDYAGYHGMDIWDGVVENVTVQGTFEMGIVASGTSRVTDCTLENNGWGVYAEAGEANSWRKSQAVISGCTFNSVRAIRLEGTEQFTDNVVNGDKGVSVAGGCTATVTGNTFTGDRALSLSANSQGITFTGNRIMNNGAVEYSAAANLNGNYWESGTPKLVKEAGEDIVITSSLTSDPAVPAYAGPVMNWVKVNAANNGVVKSGPLAASAGATVTLYPKAAEGYVLDTVEVLDAEGNAVEMDGLKFAIPAGGVTVNATFKLAD